VEKLGAVCLRNAIGAEGMVKCGRRKGSTRDDSPCAQPTRLVRVGEKSSANATCSLCSLYHHARTGSQLDDAPLMRGGTQGVATCSELAALLENVPSQPEWLAQEFSTAGQRMLVDWGFASGEGKKFELTPSGSVDLVAAQLLWSATGLVSHIEGRFSLSRAGAKQGAKTLKEHGKARSLVRKSTAKGEMPRGAVGRAALTHVMISLGDDLLRDQPTGHLMRKNHPLFACAGHVYGALAAAVGRLPPVKSLRAMLDDLAFLPRELAYPVAMALKRPERRFVMTVTGQCFAAPCLREYVALLVLPSYVPTTAAELAAWRNGLRTAEEEGWGFSSLLSGHMSGALGMHPNLELVPGEARRTLWCR